MSRRTGATTAPITEESSPDQEAAPGSVMTEAQEAKQRALAAWQETQGAIDEQETLLARTQADLAALLEQSQQEDSQAEGWRTELDQLRQQITSARVTLDVSPKRAEREGISLEQISAWEARKAELAAQLGEWEENAIERETARAHNQRAIAEQIKADEKALADLRLRLESLADAYRAAHRQVGAEALAGLLAEIERAETCAQEAQTALEAALGEGHQLRAGAGARLAQWSELKNEVARLRPARQPALAERILETWLSLFNLLAENVGSYQLQEAARPEPNGVGLLQILLLNEPQLRLLLRGDSSQDQRLQFISERRGLAEGVLRGWRVRQGKPY